HRTFHAATRDREVLTAEMEPPVRPAHLTGERADLPRMKVGPGTARIRVASPGLQAHELELALRGRSSPLDRVDYLSPRVRVGEPMQARRVRPHEPGRERRDFLRIAAVADG